MAELLNALEQPEIRTRYRARRELRGRDTVVVIKAVKQWLSKQDAGNPRYDHNLCEGLWVTAGLNKTSSELLEQCLNAKSHQARAAAVNVIRSDWRKIPNHACLLLKAAADDHPRVRLSAVVAASWLENRDGARVMTVALEQPVDQWMGKAYEAALIALKPQIEALAKEPSFDLTAHPKTSEFLAGKLQLNPKKPGGPKPKQPKLSKADRKLYDIGKEVYARDAHCKTCHGDAGQGDAIYPPLAGSEWVTGDQERLIRIVLKGLWGPIEVKGKTYDPAKGLP